ncbi:protein timeless homolog isoform X3 [Mytilus trossulus]|uniref:protein timeless homolog isoform X3 n=1 Tax=Mytilus trossulus TaxID=6551 RepID=UPI003003DDA0
MVMHVELQATCSSLGYIEGNKYVKEPDCLEAIKDLIRFLKREDDSFEIRRELGNAQIVQNDLLHIIKWYSHDEKLFDAVIRLLVNLTQPAILCFNNTVPTEKTIRNIYIEIESILQSYKEAFVDEELFNALTQKLGDLLKLDWEHRQEEDRLLIERILILIRNVLHVPPNEDREQRTDDDATVHDQVIWAIHCTGLEDLLLYIASSEDERNFSMHILEIVSLMFREQNPEILASAGVQRSMTEKEKDERELEMVREQEKLQKLANVKRFSTRHSRFGGTFVVHNMKSISDREVIYHKPLKDVNEMTFDSTKKPKKKPKNRQPIKGQEVSRRSTLSIRLGLKEFCAQFLDNCYNPLMYAVKDILAREKTQDHDETYYLWAMRFFMEFCRHHSKQVDLVSETMSVQTFHYIQVQLFQYYEMIMMEKKEAVIWAKRVHLALKAYQELLHYLDMMDRSKNTQLMESSKVIKGNIFYMMEFRDIFLTLLKKFDQSKQSRAFLKDLIETTHLFLKMLENATKTNSHLVVQKKKTKKGKKKKKPTAQASEPVSDLTQTELDDKWDEVSEELSALFQGRGEIPTDISPFDAASEVQEDQQRIDAMIKIQDALRENKPGEAIALIRSAREIWPERDDFGSEDISPEEEFMALREIFMANLPRPAREDNIPENVVEEYEEGGAEAEEEEMESVATAEQEFDFKVFVNKFCKGDVLKAYVLLLADFQKNSTHTNHCIIKMLHRISIDLGYMGMVFQASLFRVFQKILLSPLAKAARYKEIVKFGHFVIGKFVQCAENNKKIFMEMLFWKGGKESVECIDGYGSYDSKGPSSWTEDQETEVRSLYEEYSQLEDNEKDIAECIMERLSDGSKTRGQIIRELKKQNLISSAKELKRKQPGKHAGPWTEEDEEELTNMFQEFKSSADPLGNIMSAMTVHRSKQRVIEKLLGLGLVNDRSELYKKRGKKSKKDDYDSDSGDGYEEDGGFVVSQRNVDTSDSSSDEGEDSDSNVSDKEMDSDKENDSAPLDSPDMTAVMQNLIQKGYSSQIQWIQRAMKRVLESRTSEVSVPIVPLSEENETAMEDQMFLSFLQQIGISPPSNAQEAFWRIPAELNGQELQEVIDGITINDNGEAINAHMIKAKKQQKKEKKKTKKKDKKKKKHDKVQKNESRKEEKQKKSKKKNDMLKALAEKRKTKRGGERRKVKMQSEQSDDENEEIVPLENDENVPVDNEANVTMEIEVPQSPVATTPNTEMAKKSSNSSSKKKRRIKRLIDSDSDDSDNDKHLPVISLDNTENKDSDVEEESQSQKRPLVFGDSSDEEVQPTKRQKISDGEESDDDDTPLATIKQSESFPATLYSQGPLDSDDSEEDDHVPLRRVLQKKNIIESDEED